jgi:hypothetical protein
MRFLATGSDWWRRLRLRSEVYSSSTQASSILPVAVGGAELVRSISETSEQQRGRYESKSPCCDEDDEDCVGDRPPEDGCPDDKVSEDASSSGRGRGS